MKIWDESVYRECVLCPRECRTDRTTDALGRCRSSDRIKVARAALHMWEEPCLSGEEGSGTIFFSGCHVGCVFCQNHNIAEAASGKYITTERLAEIMLELQEKQANNINLVTPTHYAVSIIEAAAKARQDGLRIPIVYNTSGYEKEEAIRNLEGTVDIYLPDFKYIDGKLAQMYSYAGDYIAYAMPALREMVRQVGEAVFDERGILQKGVIVRHLLLPGCLEDSKRVIRYLYENYGDQIYVSIMNQYTPMAGVVDYPEINRKVTEEEYEELVDYAIELGIENGFIQEGGTASESFIPEFDLQGV